MLSPVDAAVLACGAGGALAAAQAGHTAAACALALVTAALVYVLWGPSTWLRPTPGPVAGVRKMGTDLRCPYPDAWYVVCLSRDLAPGGVQAVNVGDLNMVAWRPLDGGEAVVMDAYCPHLGAHLAVDGTVTEDGCLRCPFHGWKFSETGELAEVPGCEGETPKGGAVRKWASREQNGLVSVWVSSRAHTPPGQAPAYPADSPVLAPWYEVPAIPELPGAGSRHPGSWRFVGHTVHHVGIPLQDIPENGADVAHLPALHASFIVPPLRRVGFSHHWEATWTPRPKGEGGCPPASNNGSAYSPFVDITVSEWVALRDRRLPGAVHVRILQAGPTQVFLRMATPVGPILIIETVLPVAPARQRVLHAVYTPWYVPVLAAKAVLWATVVQFEKDVPIWCAKRYEPRPLLSKADKGIPVYRRWAQQFYGTDSVSYDDAVRRHVRESLGFASGAASSSLEW